MNVYLKFALVLLMCCGANSAMAAGGLASATTAMTDFKTWIFTFTGVASIAYLCWNVGMALAERKQWSEVGMALVYCSLAGGAVVGGTWAYAIFQ